MVKTATSTNGPRPRLEGDDASELTLDALVARMRSAAHRSAALLPTRSAANASTDGESQAAELNKLQVEFNEVLVSAISSIAQHLRQLPVSVRPSPDQQTADVLARVDALAVQVSDLTQRLDQAITAFNAADPSQRTLVHELDARLDGLQRTSAAAQQDAAAQMNVLEQRIVSGQAAVEHVQQQVAAARRGAKEQIAEIELRIFRLERDMRRRKRAAAAPSPSQLEPASSLQSKAPSDFTFDYFLFEHRFRGSIEDIKQRQQAYLDYFVSAKSVLDLGCGRGEFVELLVERGVPVIGVDLCEDMVDYCKARGLPVLHGDLFEQLAAQLDSSLDGIFVSQVVEHLPAEQAWKLIQLAGAKLRTDGVLVLETINPQCLEAMNWFYLDPTHVRPYPPALLSFMCEQTGLRLECMQFSSPLPCTMTGAILKSFERVPPAEAVQYQDHAVITRRSSLPLESQ
jgi:2-polyprenyl-3-methyl-5-hydroxy-6-metoxy-1,4-benzoquinol methylase